MAARGGTVAMPTCPPSSLSFLVKRSPIAFFNRLGRFRDESGGTTLVVPEAG
jgi:hypothetical protein